MSVRNIFDRERLTTKTGNVRITEQAHDNETDINKIIARARKTGFMPSVQGAPLYGDFTNAEDYFASRNRILEAQKEFLILPASLRQRFKNDVGLLIEFLNNEENRSEAEKLGLVTPRETIPAIQEPENPETPAGQQA